MIFKFQSVLLFCCLLCHICLNSAYAGPTMGDHDWEGGRDDWASRFKYADTQPNGTDDGLKEALDQVFPHTGKHVMPDESWRTRASKSAADLLAFSRIYEETVLINTEHTVPGQESKEAWVETEEFLSNLAAFDWIGGQIAGRDGDGLLYGLNNFNLVIPEPGQIMMLVSAAAVVVMSLRRRRVS